jgi:hypothetical protein
VQVLCFKSSSLKLITRLHTTTRWKSPWSCIWFWPYVFTYLVSFSNLQCLIDLKDPDEQQLKCSFKLAFNSLCKHWYLQKNRQTKYLLNLLQMFDDFLCINARSQKGKSSKTNMRLETYLIYFFFSFLSFFILLTVSLNLLCFYIQQSSVYLYNSNHLILGEVV